MKTELERIQELEARMLDTQNQLYRVSRTVLLFAVGIGVIAFMTIYGIKSGFCPK